jgi:hypothetical protein
MGTWRCDETLGEAGMTEAEIAEHVRLLQQAVALAGDAVDTLRRNQRADIDAVRLEVEALRRCLLLLHPDDAARFEAVRAAVLHEADPESP